MCLEGGAAVIKVDERIQEGGAAVMKVEERIQEGGAAVIKVDERIQVGVAAVIKLEERIQCFWSVDPLISELSFKYNGVTEQFFNRPIFRSAYYLFWIHSPPTIESAILPSLINGPQ